MLEDNPIRMVGSMTVSAPVLIVGATGGIGSTLARRLAAQGAPLKLVGRDPGRLETLAGELGAAHLVADVLDDDFASMVGAFAGDELAGLAYCVGSIDLKLLRRVTADDLVAAYRLNVVGAVLAVQAAQSALKKGKGSVVLFSTVAVGQGFAQHTVISAAKGGVEGVTRALAAELAPDIRVNAIAPSLTRTPLAERFTSNAATADSIAAMHALKRLGEPDDSAALAAFLLAPDAAWITGQVIGVDGGRSSLR